MQFDIESCSTPALEMPALSFGTAVAVQTRIARCLKSDATAEQWPRLQVLHFTFESALNYGAPKKYQIINNMKLIEALIKNLK